MFGHTWVGQMRHMRMARQHLAAVIRAIGADPAFRDIKVGVGTGGDGSILVVGRVSAQSDLDKLEAVIAGTQPPVKVTFSVTVGDRG